MYPIELIKSDDATKSGHLYCGACVEELNVILSSQDTYANPNYKLTWDVQWHEFYGVRLLFPKTLKQLLEDIQYLTCPCCSELAKIHIMTNGPFDIKLIGRSLSQVKKPILFKCIRCEGGFASQNCVMKLPDTNQYICGDCAAAAAQ